MANNNLYAEAAAIDPEFELPTDVRTSFCSRMPHYEFTLFKRNETGDYVLSPRCPVKSCGKMLKVVPDFTGTMSVMLRNDVKHKTLYCCPDAIQYDENGRPTGRPNSWAHNRALFDIDTMRKVTAYRTPERKMMIRLDCSAHYSPLRVVGTARSLQYKPQTHPAFFAAVEKLTKFVEIFQQELPSDADEAQKLARDQALEKAKKIDLYLCRMIEDDVLERYNKQTQLERAEAERKRAAEGKFVRKRKLDIGNNNAVGISVAYAMAGWDLIFSAGLTGCTAERFNYRCANLACAAFGNVYDMHADNQNLIYDVIVNREGRAKFGQPLPADADMNKNYQRNCLPLELLTNKMVKNDKGDTVPLSVVVNPEEYRLAIRIDQNIRSGKMDSSDIPEFMMEDRVDKRRKVETDLLDLLGGLE